MGRYYYGTISGKLWFGIQDSYDASHFKEPFIMPEPNYVYYVCGCDVTDNDYCINCFPDYETHINSMDDCDKSSLDTIQLSYNSYYINYDFDASDLEFINYKLELLENKIGYNLIEKLNLIIDNEENNFEYNIDFNILNNIVDDEILKIIARWCFGKQIQKAIIMTGNCNINCEL
jgi:hypothetical protein